MYLQDFLKGKRFLITGGGSGLGFGMTRRLLQLGAECVICGRTEERLTKASKSLDPDLSGRLHTQVCDVRSSEDVDKLISSAWPLDGIINNAAGNFYTFSENLTPNGFASVVDIVLKGTFNCSSSYGKKLIGEGKQGSIINIVTTYAHSGSAFVLPSASAKGGVLSLTRSLAVEWGAYGIRVNAIAPGPIPTKGAWKRLVPSRDIEQKMLEAIPMKRYGTLEELGNLAVFLLSPLSSFITGACIPIDGGEGLKGSGFNPLDQHFTRPELKKVFDDMRTRGKS